MSEVGRVDWHQQEVLLIREVGRLLGRSVEPHFVIRQTLRLLSEWVGLNRGRVLLWDAGAESLRVRHWYGLTADEASRGAFARGEGVCGSVMATGLPRIVQDIDAEPDFLCRTVERHRLPKETVSFLAVPLREGDRVCGVLAAHRLRMRRRGLNDDLELLQTVGTLLGQVIRVNEELRRRTARLEAENRDLRERLGHQLPNFGILGDAPALREAVAQAHRVAAGDLTVLLLGESGTGKELFARAIHDASPRARRPFVKVNCAAVPEALFESEFFGHERGAFTGAVAAQPGRFEQADGGTLFLDEVGELPLAMQAKLLRDRTEDIPMLVRHYAHEACLAWSRDPVQFSEPAMRLLQSYPWPGNVRQLQSLAMRLVLMNAGALIDAAGVAAQLKAEPVVSIDPAPLADSRIVPAAASLPTDAPAAYGVELVRPYAPVVLGDAERVRDALARAGGNRSRAAQMLGMTRRQFTYRLEKLGVDDRT